MPEKGKETAEDTSEEEGFSFQNLVGQELSKAADEEVAAAVKKILDEKVAENETMEVKKFLFGSIELTSLHTEDTEERDRKSTRLNSSHITRSRMPSSA